MDTRSRSPCTCPNWRTCCGSSRSSNHTVNLATAFHARNMAQMLGHKYPSEGPMLLRGNLPALAWRRRYHALADRFRDRLCSVADREPRTGMQNVVVDRALGEPERDSDFSGRLPPCNSGETFELSRAQRRGERSAISQGRTRCATLSLCSAHSYPAWSSPTCWPQAFMASD